jgi:hypothetical protein
MATKKKKKDEGGGGFAIGLAAVAATAAAGYFLYGKDGEKNRKKLKGWMVKAKGEAIEKIEKLKSVDEVKYHAIIDSVGKKYCKAKNIDNEDVEALMADLKKHWAKIQKDIEPAKKKAKTTAKKAVHKAAKKVAKKTAPQRKPAAKKKTTKKA